MLFVVEICGYVFHIREGVLRFKAHIPRKQQTPLTAKRWSTTGKADWDVVDG